MRSTVLGLVALVWGVGCSGIHRGNVGSGGVTGTGGPDSGMAGGSGSGGLSPPTGGKGGSPASACDPCTDFPTTPLLDTSAATPSDAGALFGPAGSASTGGGPCVVEPEPDSLFPRNWLRPRVRFVPGAGQDLFEIRIHVAVETNDLIVYTSASAWTMPKDLWAALSAHAVGRDITVTVRGVSKTGGTPALGTSSTIRIAPAKASGTIVYWTTSGGTALKGFHIGDESVVTVMRPADVGAGCVGCHSSTPDGNFIGFASAENNGNIARLGVRSTQAPGAEPAFLTPSARTLLAQTSQEFPTFSGAHWTDGDHVVVFGQGDPPASDGKTRLRWIDLEATSTDQGVGWGELSHPGDSGASPVFPFFSHDGQSIVYTSASNAPVSGKATNGDLYRIPYDDRKGGAASAIAGASTAEYNEFYPALSHDDTLLGFTRVAAGMSSYDQTMSEVFVVPYSGGTATRLAANQPSACLLGNASPGITNSWPKWAPAADTVDGITYYWLIFSSRRNEGGLPQLFLAGVTKDAAGNLKTTPALYLWNQPPSEGNHTPAWDVFKIPVVP